MEKYLLKEIQKMEGTLLGIGLHNKKFEKAINQNSKITICNLLEEPQKRFSKHKFKVNEYSRTVNIKKLRKVFHQKKTNYIICNSSTIKPFLKSFVKDSVYINSNKLYIYGKKKELQEIMPKYQRYTNDIVLKEFDKKAVLIVNNTETKNNFFKDLGYFWKDTFNNLLDALTHLLAN